MLNKKFRLYITPAQRKQFMQDYKQEFNDREFLTFLKKFRGSMVFRGKSSFSYKLYDRINLIFKKSSLKKKVNPEAVFRYAISNLIPVVGISNIKRGRKVETVPVLLKLRKRIVLINK
jgi:ribosomal protein S7